MTRFIGKAQQGRFHRACNDPSWYATSADKALFYTILAGAGLPVPATRALSGPKYRAGVPRFLADKQEVISFLAANRNWPLFMKPVDGMYSIGAMKANGCDQGRLQLGEAGQMPLEKVVAYMEEFSGGGYLFQETLQPSDFCRQSFGDALASVRLLVLYSAKVPEIESAVVKIPLAQNIADNYWRSGNMLGAVALDSGLIQRVVSGFGYEMKQHETHPATGVSLVGLKIPDWQRVLKTALEAAKLFPGVRTQSWDVSITDCGPVLLEYNWGGDLNLHQLAHHRGILSERLEAHLRRCGYRGKLS